MNQDNMLCEAMKFRNLTSELQPSTKGSFHLFADDDEDVEITRKTIASELAFVIRSRQVGGGAGGGGRAGALGEEGRGRPFGAQRVQQGQ